MIEDITMTIRHWPWCGAKDIEAGTNTQARAEVARKETLPQHIGANEMSDNASSATSHCSNSNSSNNPLATNEKANTNDQQHVELATDTAVAGNKKLESRLVRKQDLAILPLLALAMMTGYLDRATIGNARLLGLQRDMHLSNQQYLNCVMMFFLGYMIIELLAGMSLRYVHPRYVFASALLSFGLFTVLLCTAGYAGVMVLRVLTGLAEAFVNNAFIFASLWYRAEELSLRAAAIYSMTPVAGAVSGLIAYGVGKHLDGAEGLQAWKWLFIIEGCMTMAVGLLVLFLLPGLPETVAEQGTFVFRSQEERSLISQRTKMSQNTAHAGFQPRQVILALRDPKTWLCAAMIAPVGIGIGAFTIILPTLIHGFGFAPLESQLITLIPYGCGLLGLILFAWLSDHLRRKALVTLICICITCAGFVVLIATTNKIALTAGTCLVAGGAYPALVVSTAWALTIHGGYTKRATAIWIIQIFIQCYSIISTQVYRKAPRFFMGHGLSLGLYVLGAVSVVILWTIVRKANGDREARRKHFEAEGLRDSEMERSFEESGDFHPGWIYAE